MGLLRLNNYTLEVEPEAIAIKAIRKLWDRDKTDNKNKAILELSYIYFLVDPRSTYSYITNIDERSEKIIIEEGFKEGWQPDKSVLEAIEVYKSSITTTSSLLLEDVREAIDKLRLYLKNIDLDMTDDKGKPIYTINTLVSAIKQIPDLLENLSKAEKLVVAEIIENGKMRGQKNKKILEDGL